MAYVEYRRLFGVLVVCGENLFILTRHMMQDRIGADEAGRLL